MDNQPEKAANNNGETNLRAMEQFAEQAAQEIIQRINEIQGSTTLTAQEKEQHLVDLATEIKGGLTQSQETIKTIQQQESKGELTTDQQRELKDAKQNLHKALIHATTLADKDVKVVENRKAQGLLKELAKQKVTESQALTIQENLGKWILGDEEIVISKKGKEKSNFNKSMEQLKTEDEESYSKVKEALIPRSTDYGLKESEMRDIFEEPANEQEEIEKLRKFYRENPEESDYERDRQESFQRFTENQKKFLHNFYSPEKFKKYIEDQFTKYSDADKQKEIRDKVLDSFKNLNRQPPVEEELNRLINQSIKIEVSQGIANDLSDTINQLYLQLQLERPQKFFEEIEREDFLHGIEMIRNKISMILRNLQTNLDTLERDKDTKNAYSLKLVSKAEEPYTTMERNKDGKMQPYLRVRPLPFFKEVSLSKYVQSLTLNFNHWRHRGEYLHNGRAIFSQPGGKEGFYATLANYAEKLSGTDVDEIMMLPDGNVVYQAFILYEKFQDEEFAHQDWRHRTNQFTNQLESINTQVENQIIEQLRLLYPDIPEIRIRNAVNVAVGMSRAMFLTEPEKSAYADPTDVEGKGHPASYSTNDAMSLDVFNPLHTIMRWGGEHHWNLMYFMPIEGNKGAWDHNKLWKNMELYYNSFMKGRRELGDLGQKKLFVDEIIDFSNVGGPSKRRGWRMLQTLEGHFLYDSDGTINYPETFKAMDLIGYEAVYDFFVNQTERDKDFLSTPSAERNNWFKYIYEKYFVPLGENISFEQYMSDLGKLSEQEALRQFKEESPAINNWNEFVELTTSRMFMERALTHEVAVRFPTKFLRMDRDRFHKDGISNWRRVFELVQRETGWDRDHFNSVMKDLVTAEMLLRNDISGKIKDGLTLDKTLGLHNFEDFQYVLNKETIKELLSKHRIDEKKINEALLVYEKIKDNFLKNSFLDGDAINQRREYTFTYGLEDTDFTLMSYRAAGPRIIPRAIGDVGIMEKEVMPWIDKMPHILNDLAINGKHDFSPIIEYLRKAQEAYNAVHGTGGDLDQMYGFAYKIAGAVINYFKKDTMAKPLFGLFRMGKTNSIAAKYAGRSTAVWEWDSRDIDRFCVALESYHLLPKQPYDLASPPSPNKFHNVFIKLPFFKHPVKTPFKKRNVDFKYSAGKLRKEFGGDFKAIAFDMIDQFLPIVLGFLLWQYFKKAMEEAEGKKK